MKVTLVRHGSICFLSPSQRFVKTFQAAETRQRTSEHRVPSAKVKALTEKALKDPKRFSPFTWISLRDIRWKPSVFNINICRNISHAPNLEALFFFFFCGAPTQTPPHLTLFFFQSRAQNQQNFILKTLKNHHHRPATHSAGFNSILWLFAVTFYAMTYLHFPFTPCFNTGGFTLPTYTDVISSSRCFRPHHFRRRTTRTLHRLCACSSDPRITCV